MINLDKTPKPASPAATPNTPAAAPTPPTAAQTPPSAPTPTTPTPTPPTPSRSKQIFLWVAVAIIGLFGLAFLFFDSDDEKNRILESPIPEYDFNEMPTNATVSPDYLQNPAETEDDEPITPLFKEEEEPKPKPIDPRFQHPDGKYKQPYEYMEYFNEEFDEDEFDEDEFDEDEFDEEEEW